MSASQPLSIRMSPTTERYVKSESRRSKRPRGAVIQSLTDEAVKCRLFPGVGFRGTGENRRAWVIGTSFDVWQLVEGYKDFGSIEKTVKGANIGEQDVRLALAYYKQFPVEIDEALTENRKPLEELLAEYPLGEVFNFSS